MSDACAAEYLLVSGRTLTLARHALFLEAAFDPTLRPDLLADQLARPETGFAAAAALRGALYCLLDGAA